MPPRIVDVTQATPLLSGKTCLCPWRSLDWSMPRRFTTGTYS
jgi:hypothetical protein